MLGLRWSGRAGATVGLVAALVTGVVSAAPAASPAATALVAPVITHPAAGGWIDERATVHWTHDHPPGQDDVRYELLVDGELHAEAPAGFREAGWRAFPLGQRTFVVAAIDGQGQRVLSRPVVASVGVRPQLVSLTVEPGDRSVTISWEPSAWHPPVPAVHRWDLVVTGSWYDPVHPEWTRTFRLDGAERSLVLDGLHNGQDVTVQLTAVNAVGTQPLTSGATPDHRDDWITASVTGHRSPVHVEWSVGPRLARDTAFFGVVIDGVGERFVGSRERSLALPLQPGHYGVTIVAYRRDGSPIRGAAVPHRIGMSSYRQQLFADVPVTHPFYRETFWLAQTGVTKGYADGTFRGTQSISRDAMAAFLFRMAGEEHADYEAPRRPLFTDVPVTHPFYREISWFAEQGITTGYADGTFRPRQSVSRAAMAAFLYRLDGEEELRPRTSQVFADVPVGAPFHHEIAWFAEQGITYGYPDGTFRPGSAVRRDAMAAFLCRFVGANTWDYV